MPSNVKKAADFIRNGGLVVFPTETVYGLGADAFHSEAVARVYSTKGRPGDNPLILHIADMQNFKYLAHEPPDYAFKFIEKYWPGPLTLVVKKNPSLPEWLGGQPKGKTETIGIRMPSHPVALALIKESGRIIAAPSANKAGKPSPTTLAHVFEDFPKEENEDIFFLDGGNSIVGLESTVIDVTGEHPIILRPGAVIKENMQYLQGSRSETTTPRSPGMKYKHYAPQAEMTILSGEHEKIATHINNLMQKAFSEKIKIGILVHEHTLALLRNSYDNVMILSLGGDEETIAQNLYSHLRKFDEMQVNKIYAEAIPESGLGVAIMDRMRKAAEGCMINV